MKLRFAVAIALLFFGPAAFSPNPALGQTRLGLYHTQEEVDIWKQRASSGPYRSTGDVSTNSPGDWSRIQSNASAFLSNPSAQRFAGKTTSGCVELGTGTNSPRPARTLGERLRDAGFYFLVTGDTRYRDAVRNELLAQAATAGTNWTDSSRWCRGKLGNHEPVFELTMWLGKILLGYDYIRASLSSTDRNTLDTWFYNAAYFFEEIPSRIAAFRWPNRDKDDYSSSSWSLGSQLGSLYYGGPPVYQWHQAWDNHAARNIRFVGQVGVLVNNSFLKDRAKRWFKEYIKYRVWYTNSHGIASAGGYHRSTYNYGSTAFPGIGWGYASLEIGPMAALADVFARNGDMELYEYTTSQGYHGTHGGPKSLKAVIITHLKMMDHTVKRYNTNTTDPAYIIDNVTEANNWYSIRDTWLGLANNYFRDNYIRAIYTRKASNVPSYPSSPETIGCSNWQGEWCLFPGSLFMYGQMEDKVSVYGGTTTPPTTGSAKFSIGDRVYVTGTSNVNVRQTPGGTLLGQQPPGDQGTVTQGPIAAQIGGAGTTYNWWHIDFDPAGNSTSLNPDGWVGEDSLEKVLASASAKLIGHWKFDEGSGTVAKDSSGTGNHASLMNGAGWTTGRSGSAVSFDGLDDFVKIATTNFSAAQGTFSAWIRAPFYKSGTQYIFGHTSIPAYGNRIQFYTNDTGGNLIMGLGDNNKLAQNIQQLQTNTWHHVALTWNAGVFAVYVDGVQKTTGSYSGLASFNNYAHIGGVGLDTDPQSWAGAIDEVKIWNGALSATEVQSAYKSDQLLPPTSPSNVAAQPVAQ